MTKTIQTLLWIVGFCLTLHVASLSLRLAQEKPLTTIGWVGHTQEIYRELQAILIAALEAESGQRGFIITGNDEYLRNYEGSKQVVDWHIARIAFLMKDNPVQQEKLLKLQRYLELKFTDLADTLETRKVRGQKAAIEKVNLHIGLKRMEAARTVVRDMQDEEDRLLIIRDTIARSTFYNLTTTIILIILRDVIIFSVFWRKDGR